jgi:hypothetical protein
MPKGIKDWAIFLAAQTVLTFLWRVLFKLGEHAMLTWSDDQIASFLGFSAPQASVVISWAIPVFLGAITLWVYHVVVQRGTRAIASTEIMSGTVLQPERSAEAPAAPNASHTAPTIQTGTGGDYDRRIPSQFGGVLHTIRVKITNGTESMLTGAKLSVINLNPANAGHRDFPLEKSITLPAGENTYVNVASHTEGIEADQNLMCLQTSCPSGFAAPAGFGILTGEHRLQLRLTRNDTHLAEIYCRLYVDDHNVIRLERLDKSETL